MFKWIFNLVSFGGKKDDQNQIAVGQFAASGCQRGHIHGGNDVDLAVELRFLACENRCRPSTSMRKSSWFVLCLLSPSGRPSDMSQQLFLVLWGRKSQGGFAPSHSENVRCCTPLDMVLELICDLYVMSM